MKSKTLLCITAMTLLAALALPVQLAAQNTRYKLIDLGTLGGPSSSFFPGERLVTNGGLIRSSGSSSPLLFFATLTFRSQLAPRTHQGWLSADLN